MNITARRLSAVVVVEIDVKAGVPLLEAGQARSATAGVARRGKHRKQDGQQNGDDADDHQQLDKTEALYSAGAGLHAAALSLIPSMVNRAKAARISPIVMAN